MKCIVELAFRRLADEQAKAQRGDELLDTLANSLAASISPTEFEPLA